MPAELSAEVPGSPTAAFDLSVGARLAMVLLGYIPFLHVSLTATATAVVAWRVSGGAALASALVATYLVPPLMVRLARTRTTLSAERYRVGSAGFLRWWFSAQCQVLFNRLPVLEEILRLVPGLYSTWLRLWGAQVGPLVYWAPRVAVYDRSFLDVGARVVIGADTKICPHYLARSTSGDMELVLSPVVIGHDALVGGSSLLPSGVRIDPCEQTPGYRPMAPFAHFRGGKHTRTQRFTKGNHDDEV
jgi:hypothetical protein